MADADNSAQMRSLPTRTRSNFAARTARDDKERLHRRSFAQHSPLADEETPLLFDGNSNGLNHDGAAIDTQETESFMGSITSWARRIVERRGELSTEHIQRPSISHASRPRPGAFPRPVGGNDKLGTFAGVFVPVTLNVLSILMFLRFGFILGQAGLIGMMALLIAAYAINFLTTMSISAIATNGTVRGGGPYYMLCVSSMMSFMPLLSSSLRSRTLGPEFGGSIGIVFFLGSVFSTSLNAVGLIDCLIDNFGTREGAMSQWLPQSYWWQFLWASLVLLMCTTICLAGSGIFARASNALLIILLVAIISIPFSAAIKDPFIDIREKIAFTGFSLDTMRQNLFPNFTKGAAGSAIKGHENVADLFGILFPATGGILA